MPYAADFDTHAFSAIIEPFSRHAVDAARRQMSSFAFAATRCLDDCLHAFDAIIFAIIYYAALLSILFFAIIFRH